MHRMNKQLRIAVSYVAALLIALVWAWPAYAQESEASAADEPRWVIGYALVILSVGVGLTAICRMGRRGQDIRRTE